MRNTLEEATVESQKESLPPPLWFIPAGMLILALAPLPYGYYTLLRLVVCICSGVLAYRIYHTDGKNLWFFGFAGTALLFNPIIPIFLSREIWAPIDVMAAILFGAHYLNWKKNSK